MEDKKVEQYYTPPPVLGKWEAFSTFLWNSETGQFLGRTGSSWGESIDTIGDLLNDNFFLIFFSWGKRRNNPFFRRQSHSHRFMELTT